MPFPAGGPQQLVTRHKITCRSARTRAHADGCMSARIASLFLHGPGASCVRAGRTAVAGPITRRYPDRHGGPLPTTGEPRTLQRPPGPRPSDMGRTTPEASMPVEPRAPAASRRPERRTDDVRIADLETKVAVSDNVHENIAASLGDWRTARGRSQRSSTASRTASTRTTVTCPEPPWARDPAPVRRAREGCRHRSRGPRR